MNKNLRRNILKGLAAGAPIVWVKPVISTAIIPAHGAASASVILEELFAIPVPDSEAVDVGVEFSTIGIADGTEFEVVYTSTNRDLQELSNTAEGTITGGISFFEESTSEIEVAGDPQDANVTLEINFESGSGIPSFEASTTAES